MAKGPLVAYGLIFAAVALPLRGCVGAVAVSARSELAERPASTAEYAAIVRHLHQPFHGYGVFEVLAPQFGIVALSHMASGFLNVYVADPEERADARENLREIVRRALSAEISPGGAATGEATPLDDHNLFWSHLALILGAERFARCDARQCTEQGEHDRLLERIVGHLRSRSLQTGVYQAPSYPGSAMWPADQTVTLFAMKLFDATQGTTLHREPLRGFLAWAQSHRDPETGLFPSSASPTVADAAVPRGCASSWGASYLAQLDPVAAFDQYRRERDSLGENILGIGGFREWPVGREHGGDLDSGPIVLGVGVAATGLGLGPARIFGDDETYTVIRRAALTFGVPAWWPGHGYWGAPLLGEAILFDGRTAQPWFDPAPRVEAKPVPLPLAPALLTLANLTILALVGRGFVRALRPRGRRDLRRFR